MTKENVRGIEPLLQDLLSSQRRIHEKLLSVTAVSEWRPAPDAWSFREVAAHLATTEAECFLARVRQLVEEENPQFEDYHHTGQTFHEQPLSTALKAWIESRRELLAFVRSVPPEVLSRSGTHPRFGQLTLSNLLRLMHEHDLAHLTDLEAMLHQKDAG